MKTLGNDIKHHVSSAFTVVLYLAMWAMILLFVTSCAGHLVYDGKCLTCLNDPVTGKPVNYEQEKPYVVEVEEESKSNLDTIVLSTKIDVDSAFAAIKPEFGYLSPQELERKFGTTAEWMKMDKAYQYDANPGAYYHMRSEVSHVFQSRRYSGVVLDCRIVKEGTGSKITLHQLDGGVNNQAFTDSLLKRLRKTLGIIKEE